MGRTRRKLGPDQQAQTNHYAIMGIHDFAHGSEAKRAYHRLALKWHPDRQGRAPEHSRKDAEDRFKRINEAYAVLSDETRRKEFDLVLRSELLGMAGSTYNQDSRHSRANETASRDPKTAGTAPEAQTERSDGVRLVMCPECGIGAEAKPGKKGGPSLQCLGCSEFFHEVYCSGCKDWGATRGRRGGSTIRCGCGNVFFQSRCPSCCRWNTFNGQTQGGRTRSCGFCAGRFHEAFCPGCCRWGVWEGQKGCRSLSCDCGGLFYEISCQSCVMWGSIKGRHADASNCLCCGTCGAESHEAFCPSCRQWDSFLGAQGDSTLACRSAQCCGGGKSQKVGTRFFQVYCELCRSWMSVVGRKNNVGTASVRCKRCKSSLLGVSCPACGNWDQQRLQQPRQGEGIAKTPAQCSSCGHEPPDTEEEQSTGIDQTWRANEVEMSQAEHVTLEDAARAGPTGTTVFHAVGREDGQLPEVDPVLEKNAGEAPKKETRSRRKKSSLLLQPTDGQDPDTGKVEGLVMPAPAPTHGGTDSQAPSARHHHTRKHGVAADCLEANTTETPSRSGDVDCTAHRGGDAVGSVGTLAFADDVPVRLIVKPTDKQAALPCAPPPQSQSRRGGRRPSVYRRASGLVPTAAHAGAPADEHGAAHPETAEPELPDNVQDAPTDAAAQVNIMGGAAASEAVGPEAMQTVQTAEAGSKELLSIVPSIGEAVKSNPQSVNDVINEGTGAVGGDRNNREEARKSTDYATATTKANGPKRASSDSASKPDRHSRGRNNGKGGGGCRTERGLSSLTSTGATRTTRGVGNNIRDHQKEEVESPDDNVCGGIGIDDAPAAVAFAAVPRENSPPPPPGIRIGEANGQGDDASLGGQRGGGDEAGGVDSPGIGDSAAPSTKRRGGQGQEVIHLAFCSHCQKYQSWKAPLGDRRVKDGKGRRRRKCTECGRVFCNISYYPAR